MAQDQGIERRIITGLIVSGEYIRNVRPFWRDDLIDSPEMRRIAGWCFDHFEKYGEPPDKDIESIYLEAIKTDQIPKADAEFIEGVLNKISDEYGRSTQFNSSYLLDQSIRFFRSREISALGEELQDLVERGEVDEADTVARSYKPQSWAIATRGLELATDSGLLRVEQSFAEAAQPVVHYPGALGTMLNPHLIRDGFVAFLAPEKRGKTWFMLDLAMRAVRGKANVAFFQAGDLSESQFLRRIGVYVSRKSDVEEYCKPYLQSVGDCLLNQYDICTRADRNCKYGVYDDDMDKFDPKERETYDNLSKVLNGYLNYSPCDAKGCRGRKPTVWLTQVDERIPLSGVVASKMVKRFFAKNKRRFKLATYSSGTLSCTEISSCLDEWERQDDFVADVIIIDYADLMVAQGMQEFRHRQNAIWQGLRGVSQERHALVVTATQANAASYKQNRLNLSNFSEDKRKYAHVTAMWGLNQSPDGREKRLGILRVNELIAREGDFSATNEVVVLQDLRSGRPFMGSYRV